MNYKSLHERTDVIKGGSYRVMSSVQWGWFSHPSGRSISHLWGSSTILGEKHPCLQNLFSHSHTFSPAVLTKFQPGKSFIMTFEDEIFMSPATCGWRVSWFLNIQICARCRRRPNMKYLCLRVTQSRPRMKYSGLCHVSRTNFPPQNLPKLLSSQILRPGFKSR